MLTVKHITLSGEEMIYATPIANYVPGREQRSSDGPPAQPATLWIEPAGHPSAGTRYPLTGGTCFVMNENGKTISRYDLGASMVPLLDDFNRKTASHTGEGATAASIVG